MILYQRPSFSLTKRFSDYHKASLHSVRHPADKSVECLRPNASVTKKIMQIYFKVILTYLKSYGKTGNKNVKLVLQHSCKTSYQPRSNLSSNKSGFCKLREYWLLIGKNYAGVALYTWVSSFATKQVCLGPVNRATYTDFVAKSRTTRSTFYNNF